MCLDVGSFLFYSTGLLESTDWLFTNSEILLSFKNIASDLFLLFLEFQIDHILDISFLFSMFLHLSSVFSITENYSVLYSSYFADLFLCFLIIFSDVSNLPLNLSIEFLFKLFYFLFKLFYFSFLEIIFDSFKY